MGTATLCHYQNVQTSEIAGVELLCDKRYNINRTLTVACTSKSDYWIANSVIESDGSEYLNKFMSYETAYTQIIIENINISGSGPTGCNSDATAYIYFPSTSGGDDNFEYKFYECSVAFGTQYSPAPLVNGSAGPFYVITHSDAAMNGITYGDNSTVSTKSPTRLEYRVAARNISSMAGSQYIGNIKFAFRVLAYGKDRIIRNMAEIFR